MSQTSFHSSSGILSDLIPWIYLSFLLYNRKGFDLVHTWMANGFPYFVQFEPEFCNEELMIWGTVSSRYSFCWLYRASPSLTVKNIISQYSVLTIWWGSCAVISWVFAKGCLLWPTCSLDKTLLVFSLLHFVLWGQTYLLPRYLLTSYFCFPVPYDAKDIFFFGVISRGLVGPHRIIQLHFLWH